MDAQHVDVAALLADRHAGVLWSSTSQLQSDVVALPDLTAPAVRLLPAGTRRSLAAGPDGLVLVTVHRARPPFRPGRSGPP